MALEKLQIDIYSIVKFYKISQMMTHFKSALEGEILETFFEKKRACWVDF